MTLYENILVAYDGSDHAKKALAQAVNLARLQKSGKLWIAVVCNIVASINGFDWVAISTKEAVEHLEEENKQILAEAESLVPEDVAKEGLLEIGDPPSVILRTAKEHKADLIVMGSRGMGQLKGLVIGSVSSYILSRSECPVLIVK